MVEDGAGKIGKVQGLSYRQWKIIRILTKVFFEKGHSGRKNGRSKGEG